MCEIQLAVVGGLVVFGMLMGRSARGCGASLEPLGPASLSCFEQVLGLSLVGLEHQIEFPGHVSVFRGEGFQDGRGGDK